MAIDFSTMNFSHNPAIQAQLEEWRKQHPNGQASPSTNETPSSTNETPPSASDTSPSTHESSPSGSDKHSNDASKQGHNCSISPPSGSGQK